MRHDKGALERKGTQGPRLSFVTTAPDAKPAAVVGVLHGYADYAERYVRVGEAWAPRGIAMAAIDMRGHGRAEGPRGHCDRFEEYLDDTAELVQVIAERFPETPAVLMGHSFGGLVASSAALANPAPWRALVLSSPLFGVALAVPGIKILAGKLASRIAPRFAQPMGLRGDQMSHDPEVVKGYDTDPFVFRKATARWFTESTAAQERALARAPSLTMPLYEVVGTGDTVVSLPKARAFFDAAGSKDKTWDARDGLFHEVLNEPSWRDIAGDIASFVLAHV